MLDYEDILSFVEENDVKFIRMQFTDIIGILKNTAITDSSIENALRNGVNFDGSAIEGFGRVEESDMVLVPDTDTLAIIPWRPQQGKVARFICDVLMRDGTPFKGDPRYVLKQELKKAAEKGFTFHVGAECEFYLFNTDDRGQPTTQTHDTAGYFDLAPIDLGENARREMGLVLEEMGIQVEASHHEVGKGQHEIDFAYDEALKTADNLMTFKMVVKIIAQKHGLHATFMPKPFKDDAGSGMHINMSLYREGRNLFYNAGEPTALSQEARWFIGGLFRHIRAITAITNPLVNSYKRLVTGYEAPTQIAWAHCTRSPLVRVPAATEKSARLELRSPDPSCNPYLAFAVILAAGLEGVENHIEPPRELSKGTSMAAMMQDIVRISKQRLPLTLREALEEYQRDTLIRSVLGDHAFEHYFKSRYAEWRDYISEVHPWELEKYLGLY